MTSVDTDETAHDRPVFVGRASELALLRQYADRVRAGRPVTTRITGVAGIGKTALLVRFLEELTGFSVLRATARRGGRADSHTVLNDLLAAHRGRAVAPGAAVVSAAAELLDLLGELQADGPVAVMVDDVQWADPPTLRALTFVGRRLGADRVLTVLVGRDETTPTRAVPDEQPPIRLAGLSDTEAADLVAAHGGGPVGARAARWMRERTGGHPLHLRSLVTAGSALDGDASSERLDATILAWLDRQPGPTRRVLEALAVLDVRTTLPTLARLAVVDDPGVALAPARAAGIVDWADTDPLSPVGFGHQLQRDTIYSATPDRHRRALHAAAAGTVDDRSRWRHRVAAADTTDESLADELELAALDELADAQHDTAATYLLWAARLSAGRSGYERRLLTGCLYSLRDLRAGWASRRRDEVGGCAPSPLRDCVAGMLAHLWDRDMIEAERLFTRVLSADLGPEQGWVRRTAAGSLAGLHLWRGRGAETVAAARSVLSDPTVDPRTADVTRMILAVGVSRDLGSSAALAELAHLPARPERTAHSDLESLAARGALHAMDGRLETARDDLTVVVGTQRAGRKSAFGNGSFSYLTAVHYLLGEWDDATVTATQGVAAAEADDQVFQQGLSRLAAVLCLAGRGDRDDADRQVRIALDAARQSGTPQDRRYAAIAGAVAAQARADHAAMLEALAPVRGLDGARAALRRYRAALDEPVHPEDPPLHRGMLEAAAGSVLRELGRVGEAAGVLRTGHERFAALGAVPFAARCAGELEACDERPAPVGRVAGAPLSEREYQVIRLAQRGMTNREIAAELYLSSKTVEYHLGNVFAKLGLSNRRELRALR